VVLCLGCVGRGLNIWGYILATSAESGQLSLSGPFEGAGGLSPIFFLVEAPFCRERGKSFKKWSQKSAAFSGRKSNYLNINFHFGALKFADVTSATSVTQEGERFSRHPGGVPKVCARVPRVIRTTATGVFWGESECSAVVCCQSNLQVHNCMMEIP